jgi:hypothetical protein
MWWVSVWNRKWVKIWEDFRKDDTSFCRRALAKWFAPWSPIWQPARSTVVSVYVRYWMSDRIKRIEEMLLCFSVEHWQDIGLLAQWCDCRRGEVWWVSVCNNEWVVEWKNWEEIVLCFLVEYRQTLVLLVEQFHCLQGPVWSVSVWSNQWVIGWEGSGKDVTSFCRRALARCCAPWSPILLPPRSSVVSVCM